MSGKGRVVLGAAEIMGGDDDSLNSEVWGNKSNKLMKE